MCYSIAPVDGSRAAGALDAPWPTPGNIIHLPSQQTFLKHVPVPWHVVLLLGDSVSMKTRFQVSRSSQTRCMGAGDMSFQHTVIMCYMVAKYSALGEPRGGTPNLASLGGVLSRKQ